MTWTMPRPILQLVAAVIGLLALGSFVLGVLSAPERGRLPGESRSGRQVVGQPLQAVDATPLTDERIQGASKPELSDEEKAKLAEAKEAKEEADRQKAEAAAAAAQAQTPSPATQVPDQGAPAPAQPAPKPEEPPF